MKFPDLSNVGLLIAFLIPGFVSYLSVRLFSVRIARETREFLIVYVTLSAFNLALSSSIIPIINDSGVSWFLRNAALAAYVFVIPFLTGILIGTLIQKGFLIWLFSTSLISWTGIKPVSHIPTAWDWKFGQTDEVFVLVVLADGTEFTGLLGSSSFISAQQDERDMFIEQLFERSEAGEWQPTEKSLYISSGQIRTVEFWPLEQSV